MVSFIYIYRYLSHFSSFTDFSTQSDALGLSFTAVKVLLCELQPTVVSCAQSYVYVFEGHQNRAGVLLTRTDFHMCWITAYSLLAEPSQCRFISKLNATVIYSYCSYSCTAATRPRIILLFHFTSFASVKRHTEGLLSCSVLQSLYQIVHHFPSLTGSQFLRDSG